MNRAKPKSATDKEGTRIGVDGANMTTINMILRPALTPTEQSLFGFVFFRQVKDESISRGYLQKSIVLISPVPYINLFKEVRTEHCSSVIC